MGWQFTKETVSISSYGASSSNYDVQINTGDCVAWQSLILAVDIDAHAVTAADVVVPTVDIVRHE